VVGVDIRPQPNYPFEFVQRDALEVLDLLVKGEWGMLTRDLRMVGFDAIHASPPCQRWSSKTRDPEAHPDLITPLRPLLEATGLPYVIENVPGAPLNDAMRLCGSSFGLGVRRHRLFESNVPLKAPMCGHWRQPRRYRLYDHGKWYMSPVVHVFGTGGGKGREHWQDAMGIDWTNDTNELREAIPPAYTELIGHQLMQHIQAAAA
jgi:DNA (cytosine-5)-methyltransferase 1